MNHRKDVVAKALVTTLLFTASLLFPALTQTVAYAQGTLRNIYLTVVPDIGGEGYDKFLPENIVVNEEDVVNITVRNTDDHAHGFSLPSYQIQNVTIAPAVTSDTNVSPTDTAIPQFTADRAGIFEFFCTIYCGPGHDQMIGYLTVLPKDWSTYKPSNEARMFYVLALPDFGGDGYDQFLPGNIIVNQGDDVQINVRNVDTAYHGFTVPAYGINEIAKPAADTGKGPEPSDTKIKPLIADKPGVFTVLCTVFCGPGHQRMVMTLTVLPTGGSGYATVPTVQYRYLTVKPDFAGDGYDKYVPWNIVVNQGDLVYVIVRNTDDMFHGFGLPAFHISNETVNPATTLGNSTEPTDTYITPFLADRAGVFEFFCTIYCGPGHDQMIGYLTVLPNYNGTAGPPSAVSQVDIATLSVVGLGMLVAGFLIGVAVIAYFSSRKSRSVLA